MKRSAKIRMSILSLLLFAGFVNAQDTRFSQPTGNLLWLNPAMMVLTNDVRLNLDYRNQWATIDKGYTTYAGSITCPIFFMGKRAAGEAGRNASDTGKMAGDSTKNRGTAGSETWRSRLDIGVSVIDDKSGGFNRTDAMLSLGYTLKLNPANSVSAALNFGYIHYSFDMMNQTFDEQYQYGAFNATLPNGESALGGNKGAPDVGVGFLYLFQPVNGKIQAFGGLSGFHVNQPNMTLELGNGKLPARFDFQAGVKIIGNRLDFTPVVLYDVQGPFHQFTGGMLLDYKFGEKGKLVIGAWYKQDDAVVLQAGYDCKFLYFNYSYDFGISELARATTGLMTHEITLGFKLYDMAGKKGIRNGSFFY